jgi:hypothetical protein
MLDAACSIFGNYIYSPIPSTVISLLMIYLISLKLANLAKS